MVVSIDDIKTTASVAANASISTKGGAVSVSAQSLNQIDPNKLWLVNLYAPFDGIEAKWKAADGTSAKMGVATGAAKAFLNNLQATLSSTGGISSSFSSWVSATAKSKKLALSGLFHRRAIDPDPHDRGGPHRHARRHGRRGRQCRHQGAEFDPAHEPGGQHHPAVDVDRRREIAEAGARPRKDAGPAGLRQDLAKGFLTPKVDGFDYGSQSKDGSAIGVSVYVNVATHDTQAVVADTARIYSKDLNVEAGNELVSVTLGASGGQAKTVAVNGVVLVNVTSATTVAQVARGATVAATGTASIQARDATWVGTVAGAAAGSQTVGVGMSVAINDVNRDTQA